MVKIKNTTSKDFRKLLDGKNIICLCAGADFEWFIREYRDVDFNLLYVLDNDDSKSFIDFDGKRYIVKRFDDTSDELDESIIILTSKKYAEVIIRQMDYMENFDNHIIYIPRLFEPEYTYYDFENGNKELIPRKIHYCWFGKNEIPTALRKNIETWKKYCPDYEIIRWDESNYDVKKNKYMEDAYDKGYYAYVSDYTRLDVIHRYGGIYLDLDVELLRPWDELLSFPFFCGYENDNQVSFGLGFGAEKGNAIIRELIETYDNMLFPNVEAGEKLIPCPVYQTDILKKHGLICNGKSKNYNKFLVLSEVYLNPVNNMIGIGRVHKESFSIHHYAGSWLDAKSLKEKERWIAKYQFLIDHMN